MRADVGTSRGPPACFLEGRFQSCEKFFKACIDASFRRHRHVKIPTGRLVDACAKSDFQMIRAFPLLYSSQWCFHTRFVTDVTSVTNNYTRETCTILSVKASSMTEDTEVLCRSSLGSAWLKFFHIPVWQKFSHWSIRSETRQHKLKLLEGPWLTCSDFINFKLEFIQAEAVKNLKNNITADPTWNSRIALLVGVILLFLCSSSRRINAWLLWEMGIYLWRLLLLG